MRMFIENKDNLEAKITLNSFNLEHGVEILFDCVTQDLAHGNKHEWSHKPMSI